MGDSSIKTRNFTIVRYFPTSNYAIFFKLIFFRTASKIVFTEIKLYCHQVLNLQKMTSILRDFRIKKKGLAVIVY